MACRTRVYDNTSGLGLKIYHDTLGFYRHEFSADKWRVAYCGTTEQWLFLGAPNDAFAVVDDFGDLICIR